MDGGNEKVRIESILWIREELPGCQILLGVSNISFDLNPAVHQVLNSVFFHEAMPVGEVATE